MTESKARGYILATTVGYLRETAGPEKAAQIIKGLSPQLQTTIETVSPATWYPVSLLAELNRAMVSALAGKDEASARELLEGCGRYMGHEASNTFLRLFMRMLTPNLFAKKLPDIWKRDFTGGRLEIDVTEGRLICRIFDTHGHDHIGPISAGWIGFALKAMGKQIEKVNLQHWSLSNPNPSEVAIEYLWKT
jgi:hypothetical protein